jgi:DNA repair exonuclease SbcCD ATPase subunit
MSDKLQNDLTRANSTIADLKQKLASKSAALDAAQGHAARCETRANESVMTIERLSADAATVCGGRFAARDKVTNDIIGFVWPVGHREAFEVTDAVCHGTAKLEQTDGSGGSDEQGVEAIEKLAAAENELATIRKELTAAKGQRTKAENALDEANNAVSERDQAIEDQQARIAELEQQLKELGEDAGLGGGESH